MVLSCHFVILLWIDLDKAQSKAWMYKNVCVLYIGSLLEAFALFFYIYMDQWSWKVNHIH